MTSDELALEALRQASAIYHQADAHRTEMIGLCRDLGVPLSTVRRVLGVAEREDREDA